MRKQSKARELPDWTKLLVDAVSQPGILSAAYHQFWNYSVGNQILAIFECMRRGLQPGPINTFNGWFGLGRHVKKGEKAITLCMPVTVKRKSQKHKSKEKPPDDEADHSEVGQPMPVGGKTIFMYKARWFVLSQTEGEPYVPTELPRWSESNALRTLNIERIAFAHPNGNCQGYASQRQVAVSPIAALPHKTLFHELAHVVLEHTLESSLDDHDRTPKSLREVEAECVALICCESLNLPGDADCRGYIQHWLQGRTIPDRSAQRIFRAADTLLKAGCPPISRAPNL